MSTRKNRIRFGHPLFGGAFGLSLMAGFPVGARFKEGDGGEDEGEGGGGGGEPSVADQIKQAVEAATRPIKANRDTILAEKRALKDKLDELSKTIEKLGGDEGITRLVAFQETLSKDEMGKLLAEGKHDEWFEKKTAALHANHQREVEAFKTQVQELTKQKDEAVTRFTTRTLENDVRAGCSATSVVDSAIGDVVLRAGQVFVWDETLGRHVQMDESGEVVYGKDGKTPKTPHEWIEEQRESSRHWFPPSKGAGADGSGGKLKPTTFKGMSMAEYEKYRAAEGVKKYGTDNL
jgi:hypothetical protein